MRPSENYIMLLMGTYVVIRNIYTWKALARRIGNAFYLFSSPFIFSSPILKRSLAGPIDQVLIECQILPIPI